MLFKDVFITKRLRKVEKKWKKIYQANAKQKGS